MAYLKHDEKVHQVIVKPSGHVVTMEFLSGPPVIITTGFKLYLDLECKMLIGRYTDFKTVYRNDAETAKYNGYQLSDDGSVYVVKTTKFVTKEDADAIAGKREHAKELRKKRKQRNL